LDAPSESCRGYCNRRYGSVRYHSTVKDENMTNGELIEYLSKFPKDAQVDGLLVTENGKMFPVLESSTLDSQDGEISWEIYTGEEYDCS